MNPNEKTLPVRTRKDVEFADDFSQVELIVNSGDDHHFTLDVAALLREEAPARRRAGLDDLSLDVYQVEALRDACDAALRAISSSIPARAFGADGTGGGF